MTMPEQQLHNLRDITLTTSEREVLRHKLHAFAIANAPRIPYGLRTWRWAVRHGAFALGLALLFVAGGTGVSAERSLPGDFLYGFRVSVNERVEAALAFNDDAQVDVEMGQIQRMLDDEDEVRDEELTALAFEAAQDTDEDFEDEFDRELREIERELEVQTEIADGATEDGQDSRKSELREPSRDSDDLDSHEFDDELRSIERELQEEERSRIELE